jgi:hypothetical protein
VVGNGRDGSAEASSGYADAAELNPGHAETGSVDVAGQGMILTAFTDYIDQLQYENAGEKAALGPTLFQYALEITRTVAGVSREKL